MQIIKLLEKYVYGPKILHIYHLNVIRYYISS